MILSLDRVGLRLPGVKQHLLHNISYELEEGDFMVVVGPNGSGKSSMLKVLNGTMVPSHGSAKIEGLALAKMSRGELARSVATITQDAEDSLFSRFTISENFLMYAAALSEQRPDLLAFLKYLKSYSSKLALFPDTYVMNLSGGEKQILLLAIHLFFPRKIILLDEHTSALDPSTAAKVMRITNTHIVKRGLTAVMITHNLDEALAYGNILIALNRGEIAQTFQEQRKNALTKEELLHYCY